MEDAGMAHAPSVLLEPASPSGGATGAPARFDYLDGLRALAALYVLLNHTFDTIWPPEYQKYPAGVVALLTNWLAFGHFAVSAFIVISGFCLMLPLVRGGAFVVNTPRFLKRRARRILPPYYCALAVSALLGATLISTPTGTHWDVALPVTIPALYAHVFLLQDLAYSVSINHAMWSIAVEWQIYFLFPLLVAFWRRAGALAATLTAVAISYAVYVALASLGVTGPNGVTALMPQYVGLFAMGMAGAALAFGPSRENSSPRLRRIPWSVLALCALAVVCVLNALATTLDVAYADLFMGIATTCALVGASRMRQSRLRRLLSWRPLVFVGTMSYSLYLIHAPLLQLVWQYALHPLHLSAEVTFFALLLAAPLIVALAYLFFLLCERPFLTSPPPLHPWLAYVLAASPAARLDGSHTMAAASHGKKAS